MKNKLSLIAIFALSSQLALADTAADLNTQGATITGDTAAINASTENESMTTTTSTLPLLSDEVGSSLQSKLDAQMEFDLGPQPSHEHVIASID